MRARITHGTGWLVIVLVVLLFIGEAYASPAGIFERWERSAGAERVGRDRPIDRGGVPWGPTWSGPTGGRRGVLRAEHRSEYIEDVARQDGARPLLWEPEREWVALDLDSWGQEPELRLSAGGIWDGWEDRPALPSGLDEDERGDDRAAGDR
jgi:hypothetical protein